MPTGHALIEFLMKWTEPSLNAGLDAPGVSAVERYVSGEKVRIGPAIPDGVAISSPISVVGYLPKTVSIVEPGPHPAPAARRREAGGAVASDRAARRSPSAITPRRTTARQISVSTVRTSPIADSGARIIHIRATRLTPAFPATLSCSRRAGFFLRSEGTRALLRSYQALTAHWRETLPASHFLEVDYEAVVEDVEGQARRMLKFLGLPWDERVLKIHGTERSVSTASVNQVREPIYASSAGLAHTYCEHLGPLINELGCLNGISQLIDAPHASAGAPQPDKRQVHVGRFAAV